MKCIISSVMPLKELPNTPPLKEIASDKEIEESYAAYLTDESRFPDGKADKIIFAYSEKQVAETLKQAFTSSTAVTVSAGRTGIVGGAVPQGGILLSLEGMNHFLGARWDEKKECWCVKVQPGLTIAELQQILHKKDFAETFSFIDEASTAVLQKFSVESDKWFYPPDPTEKSAHIGGTVATNASGARSFKYGQTRKFVTALRVVLADGTVLSLQRGTKLCPVSEGKFYIQKENGVTEVPIPTYSWPKVKNAAGYYTHDPLDIIDLFIGSEGTLGVITEIEVALRKKPDLILGGIAFFPSEKDAIKFVKTVRENNKSETMPTALEYFDTYSLRLLRNKRDEEGSASSIPPFSETAQAAVYFEQEGNEENLEELYEKYEVFLSKCGTSMTETWGAVEEEELSKMADFRHALPETVNTIIGQRQKAFPHLHKIGTDFSVPDEKLEKVIELYYSKLDSHSFEYVIFGHIGQNHLHVNILPRNDKELEDAKKVYTELASEIVAWGGTVSAEHGIGKIKKQLFRIMYSQKAIEAMKELKRALDPKNLLGPENLF